MSNKLIKYALLGGVSLAATAAPSVVAAQDGDALALEEIVVTARRREESAEETILRRNIDEIVASPISMMPENLEVEVSPRDLADLNNSLIISSIRF